MGNQHLFSFIGVDALATRKLKRLAAAHPLRALNGPCSNGGLACVTLGEMRESGPTRLLVYCADYRCAHSVVIDARQEPDHVRLSDLEPKFTCQACGHRGADVRPFFEQARMGTGA